MTATTARRRAFGAAAAILALLVLSACGEAADGDGVASAEGEADQAATEDTTPMDADAQALAFAECMREEGIDMPDPAPGQRGLGEAFQHGAAQTRDRAAFERAQAACQEFLPQFEHGDEAGHEQERREMMLELAECIRAQGFDVSDDLAELRGHDAIDDDDLRVAMEECRDELGAER